MVSHSSTSGVWFLGTPWLRTVTGWHTNSNFRLGRGRFREEVDSTDIGVAWKLMSKHSLGLRLLGLRTGCLWHSIFYKIWWKKTPWNNVLLSIGYWLCNRSKLNYLNIDFFCILRFILKREKSYFKVDFTEILRLKIQEGETNRLWNFVILDYPFFHIKIIYKISSVEVPFGFILRIH